MKTDKHQSVTPIPSLPCDRESPTHALRLHLEDLNRQLRLLPLHSRLRGPLITRIRDVEDQLAWVEGV